MNCVSTNFLGGSWFRTVFSFECFFSKGATYLSHISVYDKSGGEKIKNEKTDQAKH